MFEIGDQLSIRGLFWAPSDTTLIHNGLGLAVGSAILDEFDPAAEAREFLHIGETPAGFGRAAAPGHFNALGRDVQFTVPQGNPEGSITLVSTTGSVANGQYVHAAGAVFTLLDSETGQRKPGLYYSALADGSWSYSGFGSDREPASMLDKVFTKSQFTHWLDITTLETSQPVVFIYYLAAEPDNTGNAGSKIEAMVDQAAAGAMAVGIENVRHLLVMPHFHRIGSFDLNTTRARFLRQRDAMFEIADRRPEVSAVSIYDATDGVLLDGSPEARNWLRENAEAPFVYAGQEVDLADGDMQGDLLDTIDVHPVNNHAAAFFAKKVLDAIFEPLAADINQDGFLDNGDILEFVTLFLNGNDAADMNGDGFIDNGDIIAFVAMFSEGC